MERPRVRAGSIELALILLDAIDKRQPCTYEVAYETISEFALNSMYPQKSERAFISHHVVGAMCARLLVGSRDGLSVAEMSEKARLYYLTQLEQIMPEL